MHLAFVNGSNKRDFYVMRKEAKNVCLVTGTIFFKSTAFTGDVG